MALTSIEIEKLAEEDVQRLKTISNYLDVLVLKSNVNQEDFAELFKLYSGFFKKDDQVMERYSNPKIIWDSESYINKFISLKGIDLICSILENWFKLKSTLLTEYNGYKIFNFNETIDRGMIRITGILFNLPIFSFTQTIGSELISSDPHLVQYCKTQEEILTKKAPASRGIPIYNGLSELILHFISKINLQYHHYNKNKITDYVKNNRHLLVSIYNFTLKHPYYYLTSTFFKKPTIKDYCKNQDFIEIINSCNDFDELEGVKELKLELEQLRLKREQERLEQERIQQERAVIALENERKKHYDYFLSFIKPYEEKIKTLESQVAYLRQSIVQLSKTPTVMPPPTVPTEVLNEISEDPI